MHTYDYFSLPKILQEYCNMEFSILIRSKEEGEEIRNLLNRLGLTYLNRCGTREEIMKSTTNPERYTDNIMHLSFFKSKDGISEGTTACGGIPYKPYITGYEIIDRIYNADDVKVDFDEMKNFLFGGI